VRVVAVGRADGNEEDLRQQAKNTAPRKLARFLDAVSYAPFVATSRVFDRLAEVDPADVALYSVSSWDGDMPEQPFVSDGSWAGDGKLSQHILGDANPVTWLRMLANNPLCQVSIARGFRGPNAHFVGGWTALEQALVAAEDDLLTGAAQAAIVVAYETRPGDWFQPSGSALTSALAVAFRAGGDDLDRLEEQESSKITALDVLERRFASQDAI